MSLPYQNENVVLAKELRKEATPQEKKLWYEFLCKYRVRFQRQKAIDHFIADFYCHKAKLVVEIDGAQHYTQDGKEYDYFRTEQLKKYQLCVIRFTNRQIETQFREVCAYINKIVEEKIKGL